MIKCEQKVNDVHACAMWTENNDCACMSTCVCGVVVYATIRHVPMVMATSVHYVQYH